MLEQLEVRDPILEDDESRNSNVWENKASSKHLHFARLNPEVGGLCGSCINFRDCTYPKTIAGSLFCDEYAR
jgi:hypothetical protein